jgi:hypothetical protein
MRKLNFHVLFCILLSYEFKSIGKLSLLGILHCSWQNTWSINFFIHFLATVSRSSLLDHHLPCSLDILFPYLRAKGLINDQWTKENISPWFGLKTNYNILDLKGLTTTFKLPPIADWLMRSHITHGLLSGMNKLHWSKCTVRTSVYSRPTSAWMLSGDHWSYIKIVITLHCWGFIHRIPSSL